MLTRILSAVLCVGLTGALSAQRDLSEVTVRSEHLRDSIFVLFGSGGNIGLAVGEDAAYLVDAQFAPLTEKLLAEVHRLTDKPLRYLVNTHWHGDHTGGNDNFHATGMTIVAHEAVRERMATPQDRGEGRITEPRALSALPTITYAEGLDLYLDSTRRMHVFHVDRAHTDGDSFIWFAGSNVLHLGDNYFSGRYPYIDTDSGGDIDGLIANLGRALVLTDADTRIIPGHGEVSSAKELREHLEMLTTIRDRVRDTKLAGTTLEQAQQLGLSKEWDAAHGGGFISPERLLEAIWATVDLE